MTTIAQRLAEARKNRGLTQSEAADKLLLTTQSISAWERGNSIPDTEKIADIAALYRVSTDWLLTGKMPSEEIMKLTADLSDRLFNESRMATYIAAYCDAKHLTQTKKALAFAKEKHKGQFRKTGRGKEKVPYIYHPLMMTCHALALGMEEEDLLSACLLHDVCEDCGVLPEELPVNDRTREAVRRLTKPEGFAKTEEEERIYYEGIAGDRISTIVKILDRCNNVSGMAVSFSEDRMADYIWETQEYIYPLIEKARKEYPQYSSQLFLIKYHMNSVTETIKHLLRPKN